MRWLVCWWWGHAWDWVRIPFGNLTVEYRICCRCDWIDGASRKEVFTGE